MKIKQLKMIILLSWFYLFLSCQKESITSVTVPFTLDHNRMIVDAEMQCSNGSWRTVRLWVDSGNPDFFISEILARELGIEFSKDSLSINSGRVEVTGQAVVRMNGMPLNLEGVRSFVLSQPFWLFTTMKIDANLPSTALKNYQVIFDYPRMQLTLAQPGTHKSQGERIAADIHPKTGIAQVDLWIAGDSLSFALDIGASYSFGSQQVFKRFSEMYPDWPIHKGAIGCANIWGWVPGEEAWPMIRIPKIICGPFRFINIGLVCPSYFFANGQDMMAWYSQKTARKVDGLLGPNVFKQYRLEIDYRNRSVFLEKADVPQKPDMDLVGLTLRLEEDSMYTIIGIAEIKGKPAVPGVMAGDRLVRIDNFEVKGATMGAVVDALRGTPGDIRKIELERDGKKIIVTARVHRFL
jgi:hypothetical protein